MDMVNLLCWIGFFMMLLGFVSFIGGFAFLFDPMVWFMGGVLLDYVSHHMMKT